jgi:predicted RNase H-like HicB family nuclease
MELGSPAYIKAAMRRATIDQLEVGSFGGEIPGFAGVIAFGVSRRECEMELRSTLEEWVLPGLRLNHSLPEIT